MLLLLLLLMPPLHFQPQRFFWIPLLQKNIIGALFNFFFQPVFSVLLYCCSFVRVEMHAQIFSYPVYLLSALELGVMTKAAAAAAAEQTIFFGFFPSSLRLTPFCLPFPRFSEARKLTRLTKLVKKKMRILCKHTALLSFAIAYDSIKLLSAASSLSCY